MKMAWCRRESLHSNSGTRLPLEARSWRSLSSRAESLARRRRGDAWSRTAGQRLRRVTAAQRPRAAAAAAPPHRPPARLRRGRARLLPGAADEPASPPLRVPTRSAAATVDRDLLLPRWRAATRRPRFAHLLVQRRLLRDSPRGPTRWKSEAEGQASQEQICQSAEAAGSPVLMWRAHLPNPVAVFSQVHICCLAFLAFRIRPLCSTPRSSKSIFVLQF